jgi:hypothetical protein
MQIADLEDLHLCAVPPLNLRLHLHGTRIVEDGECIQPWLDVLIRYRDEWLKLIADGQSAGRKWAGWFRSLTPIT